jgi:3-oxoacyl-[acyl-carrier-protein] synthase-3
MRPVHLTAVSCYLPNRSVSNAALPALDPPLSEEQLARFGVLARGVADPSETVVEMAVRAANDALSRADVTPASLDFVLLANWSERRYVPDLAPLVAHRLGAHRAFAYDVGAACCGFVIGLSNAWGYLQQPRFNRGLVVSADRSSQRMRPGSRATIVFGDGAAAAVVDATNEHGFRLRDYELRSDGAHSGIMEVDAEAYLVPHIPQRELNPLAGMSMAKAAHTLLERNGLTLDDIDYVVPHSGTAGVQEQLLTHLGVPPAKVLTNFPSVGNMTSASIPSSMRHFLDHGTLNTSHRILAVAVGLGWNFVAMLLEGSGLSERSELLEGSGQK